MRVLILPLLLGLLLLLSSGCDRCGEDFCPVPETGSAGLILALVRPGDLI
ncbi:MAG: hypothetical protein ACUVRH_00875 [Candidatus Bipolaricaulia bacterium]